MFLFFRWNNKLCTWLSQLFCVHWGSLPWKASCFHCGKCLLILFLDHMIFHSFQQQSHKLLGHHTVGKHFLYLFSRSASIFFRWNFVVGLCAGAPVQFLHLLVCCLINKWLYFFILDHHIFIFKDFLFLEQVEELIAMGREFMSVRQTRQPIFYSLCFYLHVI